MAARLHEMVWATVLLDACPNIGVLTVQVKDEDIRAGDSYVPVIEVDVHAKGHDDAVRLARALRLREAEGRVTESEVFGPALWRTFRGWVPDGSREAAVLVEATGAGRVDTMAVA